MEHRRTDGTLAQGYYCPRCGQGGLSMMGHGLNCTPNPELVRSLDVANGPAMGWAKSTAKARAVSNHPDRHRMLGHPPSAETLKFLGVSEDEWRFVQGRFETARKELTHLRTGVRRVAEMTGDPEVLAMIPEGEETGDVDGGYDERGWNRLCGFLVGYIERQSRDLAALRAYAEERRVREEMDDAMSGARPLTRERYIELARGQSIGWLKECLANPTPSMRLTPPGSSSTYMQIIEGVILEKEGRHVGQ